MHLHNVHGAHIHSASIYGCQLILHAAFRFVLIFLFFQIKATTFQVNYQLLFVPLSFSLCALYNNHQNNKKEENALRKQEFVCAHFFTFIKICLFNQNGRALPTQKRIVEFCPGAMMRVREKKGNDAAAAASAIIQLLQSSQVC